MQLDRYRYLYERYLKNNCSPEEMDELYKIFRQEEYTAEHLLSVDDINEEFDGSIELDAKKSDHVLRSILRRSSRRQAFIVYFKYISAAAILLVISVLVYTSLYNQYPYTNTFANRTKDIKKIKLQDGSYAILKAGSKITQITDFEDDSIRLVLLEGEAFFSIAKRPQQPFLIRSHDDFEVDVLGTRFHLNFQKDNREVVLTEGSLSIAHNHAKVIITPSQRAVYSKQTNTFLTSQVDTLVYTSWTHRQLYFKDTPLINVINQLNTHYGKSNLQIPPKFEQLQFTGYLPTNNLSRCKEILMKTFANQNLNF